MTTEEKAKAYDEAIEKAKTLKECSTNTEVEGYMDELFPQLKESEDEKIRKELLSFVRGMLECHDKPKAERDEQHESWIAWLEKQKSVEPDEDFVKFVGWFVEERIKDYNHVPSIVDIHEWAKLILKHAKSLLTDGNQGKTY